MAVVTPTITTDDIHEYRRQLELIGSFASGVHIDFVDGVFAPSETVDIAAAWRSESLITHMHVMHKQPLADIAAIITFKPDLVVLHYESDNLQEALQQLQDAGVRTGVALLPDTSVTDLQNRAIDELFDHVLVFAGHLGYQGGAADLDQLKKVTQLRAVYPDVEIGWDGGVSKENVAQITDAGVDVINVGGAIKDAEDPESAYDELVKMSAA